MLLPTAACGPLCCIRVLLVWHLAHIYHLRACHYLMDKPEESTGHRNSANYHILIPTCKMPSWPFLSFEAKIILFSYYFSCWKFLISLHSHLSDQFWSSKPLHKSTRAWYCILLNLDQSEFAEETWTEKTSPCYEIRKLAIIQTFSFLKADAVGAWGTEVTL